jgi:hypothetical protein
MENNKNKNVLEIEEAKLPTLFFPLTKDQKKIETTYNNNLASVFALLKDNKFQPNKGVPVSEMGEIIDEFFKEEIETKKKNIKENLKVLLTKKVQFDKTIEEETRKFQSIILNKKKEFSDELETVLKLVQGIDQLRIDFLKSLGQVKVEEEIEDNNIEE